MSERTAIEDALAAWRDAKLRVGNAPQGDRGALRREADRRKRRFQRLSAEHMSEQIDELRRAEARRQAAIPSTPAFHQAARDEVQIAADIWKEARRSDEETPQTADKR
jgi:hypothetical protein